MSKLDYWRWHAYEITLKLCREYGRDENGKNAFKVSNGWLFQIWALGGMLEHEAYQHGIVKGDKEFWCVVGPRGLRKGEGEGAELGRRE